jgi:acyl carrier protein
VALTEDAILADVIETMRGLSDWEYSATVTRETWFFRDLGLESIDAVVLGELLEARYGRRFPFAEFLADMARRQKQDMQVGELLRFLHDQLNGVSPIRDATADPAQSDPVQTDPARTAGGISD